MALVRLLCEGDCFYERRPPRGGGCSYSVSILALLRQGIFSCCFALSAGLIYVSIAGTYCDAGLLMVCSLSCRPSSTAGCKPPTFHFDTQYRRGTRTRPSSESEQCCYVRSQSTWNKTTGNPENVPVEVSSSFRRHRTRVTKLEGKGRRSTHHHATPHHHDTPQHSRHLIDNAAASLILYDGSMEKFCSAERKVTSHLVII